MKKYLSVLATLLFLGCSDGSQTFIHDKNIVDAKIECMSLMVFPPNKEIEDTLNSLYNFTPQCDYNLIVSYKTGIVCNSNQNSEKKAHGLPSSYLRMELKKGGDLKFTYYKDLKNNLDTDDVKDGFESFEFLDN